MKFLKLFAVVLFVFLSVQNTNAQGMNNEKLGKILYVLADSIQGRPGNWQFMIKNRSFMCLTDEAHNRMRIISPIIEQDKLSYPDLIKTMSANFHTALDVKYALSDEILWSIFVHPLRELSKSQVIDAVNQVFSANVTYGISYTSTDLVFPGSKKKETSNIQKQ